GDRRRREKAADSRDQSGGRFGRGRERAGDSRGSFGWPDSVGGGAQKASASGGGKRPYAGRYSCVCRGSHVTAVGSIGQSDFAIAGFANRRSALDGDPSVATYGRECQQDRSIKYFAG